MLKQQFAKAAFILFLTSCLIAGCRRTAHIADGNILSHASFLTMSECDGGIDVTILNPWKENAVLHSYRLCQGTVANDSPSSVGSLIRIPAGRAVVMNNCHCRLLEELGVADRIVGVCESEFISDSIIRHAIEVGNIIDCGNSMHPDIEKIIELHPDIILVSPFEESGYGQLAKLGIPLVECADYMERTPLGRTEWMRFYGLLFGAGPQADSLFQCISDRYVEMQKLAEQAPEHPRVMVDTKGGSAWYMPGGQSSIGQIISDAGGNYVLSHDSSTGSVPLSFETVFDIASDADVWILKNSTSSSLTYTSLKDDFAPYSRFKPFRDGNIWVCDVYSTPYFEITAFHPEILLQDFIAIFHPSIGGFTTFYNPMR